MKLLSWKGGEQKRSKNQKAEESKNQKAGTHMKLVSWKDPFTLNQNK